ncbi:MAG TPA: shikimate kinase [Terriglobales bacterium]|jgi:shikimate kinase|nr:shikimate kinase [Terriglobales bacterium]
MTDETVLPRSRREQACVYTVALVGFMGAGKTSVGQELARRLSWRFADLDHLIESREGRAIPQIFQQDGEQHFRNLELSVLGETLAASDSRFLVLALGGGAFVVERIRALLRERYVPAVWLDAPAEELFRRCDQPEVVRPLRRDPEQFTKLYEQRLSSYRQADLHVITKGKEISAIAEEITLRLALEPRSAE